MVKKDVVEGTVLDYGFDCCHYVVSDGNFDILHPALGLFEDKKVRIVIEEVK